MADEPQLHDLTKMLLTRLESNPEEFSTGKSRSNFKWYYAVEAVREHGAKLDKETLNAALHKFQMDEAHVAALKLLLNGDENEAAKGVGLGPARVQHNPPGHLGMSGISQMGVPSFGGGGGGGGGGGYGDAKAYREMLEQQFELVQQQKALSLFKSQYNAAHQTHELTVGGVTATMTQDEAEELGLKSKETIREVLKRKLGL
jgi:hypothetical protein